MDSGNSILQSLPLGHLVAAPLVAAVDAQVHMNNSFVNFLDTMAFDKDQTLRMIEFPYKSVQYDEKGYPLDSTQDVVVKVPFVAIAPIPNLAIETVDIEFDLRIDSMEEKTTESTMQSTGTPQSTVPLIKANVASTNRQNRKTDSSARYSFKINARKQDTPEAIMRIIDILIQSSIIPKPKK